MPERVFVSAFGDPGHAFPAIALSRELSSRGIPTALETADRWRSSVADTDISFHAAPEFPVFPTMERPLSPYAAVTAAMHGCREHQLEFEPTVVVHDILTLAPALTAELLELRRVTLVPHVCPVTPPGVPPYGLGAAPPSNPAGRLFWRTLARPVQRGLNRGEREYNELRTRVGLDPVRGHHGALSPDLVLVATYPHLEYELPPTPRFQVTGPLFWEPDYPEVSLPQGDGPLVLVAPSTAQDLDHLLLRAALKGLGSLDARVIATWNRRTLENPPPLGENTNLVEWLSYSKTMRHCDAVVSHGGHGTLARTLEAGAVPVISPAAGDQFENAARVGSLKLGVRLPKRLLSAATLRIAVEKALSDDRMRARCEQVRSWSSTHNGASRAADLIVGERGA